MESLIISQKTHNSYTQRNSNQCVSKKSDRDSEIIIVQHTAVLNLVQLSVHVSDQHQNKYKYSCNHSPWETN